MKKSTLVAASLCALLAVISIGGCGSNSSSSNPNSTQQTSSSASSSNYKLVLSDKRPTKMAYIAIVPDSPVTKDQLEKLARKFLRKPKKKTRRLPTYLLVLLILTLKVYLIHMVKYNPLTVRYPKPFT